MSILVVNTGGVTLKLTVVDDNDEVRDEGQIDPWDGNDTTPIAAIAQRNDDITAVGHRVVHGGDRTRPTLVDDAVVADLERAGDLAPIHQDRALLAIQVAREHLARLPHVACFDTSFHLTIADHAAIYPLPADWRARWPLRRTGFHGLSHEHVANTAPAIVPGHPHQRIVSCHLGSGASVCAILDGRSIDTSMGMTPLEGLAMVARSGSIDPGMLVWFLRDGRLTLDQLEDGLNRHSGLAGLAGGNGDMRDVLQRRAAGDPAASLAFDIYVHRLDQGIAAMAASLNGLDLLAFTGGIGQHVAQLRQAAVDGLTHLGLDINHHRNDTATGDTDISAPRARARCVVVATGEHHTIAARTREVATANTSHDQTRSPR